MHKATETFAAQHYVSRKVAGDFTGLSVDTIDRLIAAGKLPAYRVGRSIRLRWADVEALLQPVVVGVA